MTDPLRLLAVFAHPDDESMGMGGTLAKYSAEGVGTYLVCASRGERGWFGPEEQNPGLSALGQLREGELIRAGERLGLKEINLLDCIDGEVDKAEPEEIIGRLVVHLRRIQPQVVVTFPPDGGYGHPDHIAISQFTAAAILCASDSSYNDFFTQPAHRVPKFYYMVDSEDFVDLVSSAIGDLSFDVDGQKRGQVAWKDWEVTTRVDVSPGWRSAYEAILCHESQLASISPLISLPEEQIRQVICSQGAFYRAYSLVNGGRKVEADLFEGLR